VTESELISRLDQDRNLNFDLVFFSHTLEHFRDPSKVLQAFAGRMKPSGRIVVDFPHGRHPLYLRQGDIGIPDLFFFTEQGFRIMAEKAGCRIVGFRGLSPGPGFLAARENAFFQYLAAGLFILRGWGLGEGYFSATPPVWLRAVLEKA